MKKEFSVENNRAQKLKLSGVALLHLMHEAVFECIDKYRTSLAMQIFRQWQQTPIAINRMSWLLAIGHLAEFSTKHDVKRLTENICFPAYFKMGVEIDAPFVTIDKNGIVQFQFCASNYESITHYLKNLLASNKKLNPALLATLLIKRLAGTPYPDELALSKDRKYVLDALLLLMFGVEASRNNDTILTALLLLDLIQAQQMYGNKPMAFDWNSAFVSPHGYRWDDFENKNYGGKFPMSQNSTGTGNFGKGAIDGQGKLQQSRSELMSGMTTHYAIDYLTDQDSELDDVYSEQDIMNTFEECPQRHAVPRKEISLLIHWLEVYSDQDRFKTCDNDLALKEVIKNLFKDRLVEGLSGDLTEKAWLKPYKGAEDTLSKNRKEEKEEEEEKKSESPNRYCFYLKHTSDKDITSNNNNTLATRVGKYHRDFVACKLIPGFTIFGKKKKLFDGASIASEIVPDFMPETKVKADALCAFCSKQVPLSGNLTPRNNHVLVIKASEHSQLPFQQKNIKQFEVYEPGMTLYKNISYIMFYGQIKKQDSMNSMALYEGKYVFVPPIIRCLTESIEEAKNENTKRQKL